MEIGLVGARAAGMAGDLTAAGVRVVVLAGSAGAADFSGDASVALARDAATLASMLVPPRVVWIDVAPGAPTEVAIQDVWPELARGDLIVDASDARYEDAQRRGRSLAAAGIHFADCALRALPGGDDIALLCGGTAAASAMVAPLAPLLAPIRGYVRCGSAGAAHFVRSLLDGVALAHRQAVREAQALLRGQSGFAIGDDLATEIFGARSYDREDLAATARSAVNASLEQSLPAPVLSLAVILALGQARSTASTEHPQSAKE